MLPVQNIGQFVKHRVSKSKKRRLQKGDAHKVSYKTKVLVSTSLVVAAFQKFTTEIGNLIQSILVVRIDFS